MGRLAATIFLLWVLPLEAAGPLHQSAQRKFDAIEGERLPPGSRVFITAAELNAWCRMKISTVVRQGLRNPQITLGRGIASGSALIDFLKLREEHGSRPGWLMARLLEGERLVDVTVGIASGAGRATVDVQRVEVSGIPVRGVALDFLIQNFLLPYYPEVKIGTPFQLGHRVDRLEIKPSGVIVVIGK